MGLHESTGRWTGSWNHHSRKPPADDWLRQLGGGAICSRELSVVRRAALTVCNNSLM
jgi:hypothetical protein